MPVRFEYRFTQTSHVVAFVCTLAISLALSPLANFSTEESYVRMSLRLLHLTTFSGWFGTQLWVTFFAGLTMFRHLPRHMFGYVQSKLFPKYFLLGTVLSSVALATYVLEHPFGKWETKQIVQVSVLGLSVLSVLSNLLYIEPTTTWVMFELHKFEKKIGAGKAEGKVESDKAEKLNKIPEYAALSKRFGRLHALAAIGNLVVFCVQAVHLVYLASSFETL